jgi:hypothetical protein
MPFMRRRPLLRAAAVGGTAYMVGKRAQQRQNAEYAQDQRLGDLEQQQAAPAYQQQVPTQAGPSVTDQLSQLSSLREQGALSDEEFAAAKARLLNG